LLIIVTLQLFIVTSCEWFREDVGACLSLEDLAEPAACVFDCSDSISAFWFDLLMLSK
jgi:hypothetical protein